MKNKILCGVIGLLTIALIIEVSFVKETNFSFQEEQKEQEVKSNMEEQKKEEPLKQTTIKVYNPETKEIKEMNLEDYIIGVVAAEMPVSFELEALKAQAVTARTFAIYKKEHRAMDYDVIIGVADQAYNNIEQMQNKWKENFQINYDKIKQAVEETLGEIITYEGKTIEAFYFSMSNGHTENSELVFLESLPYLTSVESSWDNPSLQNYEVTKTLTKEEFCTNLGISCQNIMINQINRTNSGRVLTITINNQDFKGTDIRKKLNLRSTDFDIMVNDVINITTRGYGHGVGMSQYGANGMAKEGSNYTDILNHYYQNIEISKI